MSGLHIPEALRLRYVASLPAKADEFERLLSEAQSSADLSALRAAGHKLAGSAGMYGFESLGERARALVHIIDSKAGGVEAIAADVQALIFALRGIV